ncbi:MAG: DUF1501 domain-containing protein [Verrucomicrobia bacterium]|nr:DUF1501 domain-containing protein [Verrucomicrobiota bacterium]
MASSSSKPFLPSTRREFLRTAGRGIGLLAFAQYAPSFLTASTLAGAPAPEKDRPILVLVQLAGGNDGLNTLIPFEDAHYYRLRPTLGIAKDRVLRVGDTLGLHPACAPLHSLFHDGKLSIVQNVGYPNPNRSHFRSTEIWETASPSDEFLTTGWVGRYLDNACAGQPATSDPLALHISDSLPQSFVGGEEHATFGLSPGLRNFRENEENRRLLSALAHEPGDAPGGNDTFLRHTLMDALVNEQRVSAILAKDRPEVTYPTNNFASSLASVAALVAAGLPTRVYFVSLTGFDTHSNQANQHANLLTTLSEGLAAFQKDLEARKLDGQVLTMTFSEFGRRPNENESRGTDHGTAAPLFVLGSKTKGGLHGTAPSLDLAANQDMRFSTDFRAVYATALDRWLGSPSEKILGAPFAPLGFV